MKKQSASAEVRSEVQDECIEIFPITAFPEHTAADEGRPS
jgi:hypothetical protein